MKWGVCARKPVIDLREDFGPILAKVMAKVKLSENGCWEWKGPVNELGYGTTYWGGRRYMLTRLVYAAVHGAFDKDLDICHTCDNPCCCNPQHLWAGEHRANLLDGSKKKRLQGQWKTHCLRGHPLEGDNLMPTFKGRPWRSCKTCYLARVRNPEYRKKQVERQRQWREKKRQEQRT